MDKAEVRRRELRVTDELLKDRQRVLDAIPECEPHGHCVPHALEWIESAKAALATSRRLREALETIAKDTGVSGMLARQAFAESEPEKGGEGRGDL